MQQRISEDEVRRNFELMGVQRHLKAAGIFCRLNHRDGKPGVVVRGKGWTPITVGRASAGMHIVEDGLEAGDEVAL